jgi:hypothetical protein
MERLARNMENEKNELFDGRVKIKDDNFFWVETSRGLHKAKKSVSCLIEPLIFDEVLLLSNRNGKTYILSVLERERDVQSDIIFEGDVSVKVKNGDLGFVAQKLDLKGNNIDLVSKDLDIRSLRGKASIRDFTFLGRVFRGNINAVKIISKTMSSITERLTQKARQSYRWIEGLEQTEAGRLRFSAKDSLFMKGKRSSLIAEKKVKIDGEKIHLG